MPEPTLANRIANELRRSILRGELVPGAPVKERDQAATMGVSRTPMREAIRILAKEGLVELSPARSPIVSQPTAKELCDQAVVLVALEKLSGELACDHATEESLDLASARPPGEWRKPSTLPSGSIRSRWTWPSTRQSLTRRAIFRSRVPTKCILRVCGMRANSPPACEPIARVF